MLVLARLLVPADFGLVALGTGLAASLDTLSAVGVEDALVRETLPSRELYDTGFTINVLRGLLTAIILTAVAYPAGWFFRDSRLATVILVLAACAVVSAFTNIGTVTFRRDFAFDREFVLLILPRLAGLVVTITVAFVWRSYWALIGGIATARVAQLILSYTMHPHRSQFTLREWRRLAGFSAWTWALSIAAIVRDRTDSFVIGRLLGDAAVGTYAFGIELSNLPTTEVVGPLSRACFSGFSAARQSGEDVGRMYLRVIVAVALISFPAGVGVSAVAAPIIRLMLGSNWHSVVPLVEVLGPFCATTVFGFMGANLLSAYGMLALQFRITIATAVLRVALLVVLIPWYGLFGAALAAAAGILVEYTSYLFLTFRRFGVRFRNLWSGLWRTLLALSAMTLVLQQLGWGWTPFPQTDAAAALTLAFAIPTGAATYILVLLITWIASGRPPGPETDFRSLILDGWSRLAARFQPDRGRQAAVQSHD
ncbi:MAG: oligosaccharide flippase family protein [Proteobacteria bacterium]|nr:oligosaccharide flippase family protein [Pseudomonadota bacterium]